MNKNTFTTVKLAKGELNLYDFGGIKLHAYKTNDFIDDEVFIVEKNGKAVIIESPCFFDNNKELTEYLKDIEVEGMMVAYHGAGAHSFQRYQSMQHRTLWSILKMAEEKLCLLTLQVHSEKSLIILSIRSPM